MQANPFPLPHGSGGQFHRGYPSPDSRDLPTEGPRSLDIHVRDLHPDAYWVKTRDLR